MKIFLKTFDNSIKLDLDDKLTILQLKITSGCVELRHDDRVLLDHEILFDITKDGGIIYGHGRIPDVKVPICLSCHSNLIDTVAYPCGHAYQCRSCCDNRILYDMCNICMYPCTHIICRQGTYLFKQCGTCHNHLSTVLLFPCLCNDICPRCTPHDGNTCPRCNTTVDHSLRVMYNGLLP
jgi:hypothetical protein